MSINLNVGFNAAARLSGWGLRTVGVPASTVPVKNFLGTRKVLVAGTEGTVWNRPITALRLGHLTPPPDYEAIKKEVAAFAPTTTREVLEKAVSYLKAWGNDPVAEYYFEMADGKYRNVVNTSEARSIILSVAFDGENVAKVDRKILAGEITAPVNDIIHPFRILKYGINWLLIKLSAYLGFANSFIILPVYDGEGKVSGKVNIGLGDTVRLSPDKLDVLRQLAEKIKGAKRINGETPETIDREQVREFIKHVNSIPIYSFLGLRKIAEGTRKLIGMLSSSMEKTVAEQIKRDRDYKGAMVSMVNTIEAREHSTGGHCARVSNLAGAIGRRLPDEVWFEEMKRRGVARTDWERTIKREKGFLPSHALIHDIGKIGVRDAVLNKPGPDRLTPSEYAEMQEHVEIGRKRIMRYGGRLTDNPFFDQSARDVVEFHHIAYNGREGYPDAKGMREKQLPLVARIVYAADCYDAMVSKRCYQERKEPEETINELVLGLGTLFDPAVARTMLDIFSARSEENDADTYFMIEEILQVLGTESNPELRHLPEELMRELRGNSVVADLESFLAKMRRETGILKASEKWYGEMSARVQDKKQRLIAHAALSVRFFDEVAVKAIRILSDYNTNGSNYNPRAARDFMSALFKAWQGDPSPSFIELATEAFHNAGDNAADFKKFFFEPNQSECDPTPTPTPTK